MRPSIRWFPLSLTERAAWYRNFNQRIQVIGPSLGLTAGELATIQADCEMLTFLAASTTSVARFAQSFEAFRRVMTENGSGDAEPHVPPPPTLTPPAGAGPGIFDRLTRLVKRIRTAPSFTEETAALLGIARTRYRVRQTHLEDGASPKITASALPAGVVTLKFVRGASTGIFVEMRLDNDEEWQLAGKFVKSPAEFTVPPNADALPRRVQIRARFLHGNDAVGNWSDVVTVQTQA